VKQHSPFQRLKPRGIVASVNDAEAEIVLYDEIGFWGVTAEQFRSELQTITVPLIHLRINSPGGSVFEALAMYNALREHPANVVSHVDGLAASAATVVALGGDEVRMAANAFFMIHDPWALAIGNARELRDTADLLDKITGPIVNTYRAKTKASEEAVTAWMDAETWFDAEEAMAAGFADAIDNTDEEEDLAAAAASLFDLSIYSHVPDALRARGSEPKEPTTRELEKALRDAGMSRAAAASMVAAGRERLRDAGAPPEPEQSHHLPEAVLSIAAFKDSIDALKGGI
jgi:ATP-dependent protease ClpP protease subunit